MTTPHEQRDAIKAELLPLATKADLDEIERGKYLELSTEFDRLDAACKDADAFAARRTADIERIQRLGSYTGQPSREGDGFTRDPFGDPGDVERVSTLKNPWDIDVISRTWDPDELLSRALTAAEQTPGPTDVRRSALTDILENSEDGSNVSRLVLATTSPAYKTAYGKIARASGLPGADLTAEERKAVQYAESVRRAMSLGTDASGGFLVPTDIEAAVTLSAAGTNNPIYSRARRVQTTSDSYRVVTSGNAAWSWDGENTEVSDDTTTFANTDITLYVAQGFVPYSYAAANGYNATQIVADVLMGGWNDLVGAALTTGTGSSQPVGIVTALTGAAVTSASTDVFAIADVYATSEPLPARHRRNATWMSSIEALNDIRQFGTADSHALLTRLSDSEDGLRILGRPWVENEDFDGSITALANNYYLLLGDFNHFVVAEGLGTITRFIPDVVGSTGRPIGASGVFMMAHFGSDSVLDDAFRLLNVT
jgi:HK97 family phage major capsid protein